MRLVCGVGINDANYVVQIRETLSGTGNNRRRKLVWQCPYYSRWQSMLERCYSERYLNKNPSYNGCKVHPDWLLFSNFKSWMEKQSWRSMHLDKDILGKGKLYSPKTCVFIPKEINTFLCSSFRSRGEYKLGVYFRNKTGKYESKIKDPFTGKTVWLGEYLCEKEAYQSWLEKKLYFSEKLCKSFGIDNNLAHEIESYILSMK